MIRTLIACATLLAAISGCTITTRNGGGPASPARKHVASDAERPHRDRARRPARPRRVAPKPPQLQPQETPKSERTLPRPSSTKPEPRPIEPIEVEPTRPEPKLPRNPEPRPEQKPPAKQDPKPQVRPKRDMQPKPKPEPEEMGVQSFVFGAPTGLKPGLPDAFWVYQDEQGWHLRTTTDSKKVLHNFTGRIWITEGIFSDGKPSRLEQGQDSVRTTARAIELKFDTMGVMDGVDWKLTGGKCIHFELFYDGKPEAKVIHLGAKKVSPPSNVFVVCGR